jgi:hypothetical protein
MQKLSNIVGEVVWERHALLLANPWPLSSSKRRCTSHRFRLKSAPALFLRKSDSYPLSERRSEGQEANAINGRGPRLRGKEAVYGGLQLDRSGAF